MATSADIHKAVLAVWNDSGLNAAFKQYWVPSKTSDYDVLHDQAAGPTQPFPYCVFNQEQGQTTDRMTGADTSNKNARNEVRAIPFEFRIHTRSLTRGLSAKKVATLLTEEVIKIFGGHPTVEPTAMTLDNGAVLTATYETDWPIREDDQNFAWHVRYTFKVDVPVAA